MAGTIEDRRRDGVADAMAMCCGHRRNGHKSGHELPQQTAGVLCALLP